MQFFKRTYNIGITTVGFESTFPNSFRPCQRLPCAPTDEPIIVSGLIDTRVTGIDLINSGKSDAEWRSKHGAPSLARFEWLGVDDAPKKRSDSKNAEVLGISGPRRRYRPAQMHPPIRVTSLHRNHTRGRIQASFAFNRLHTSRERSTTARTSIVCLFLFLPCSPVSQVHSPVRPRRASLSTRHCERELRLLWKSSPLLQASLIHLVQVRPE